MDPATIAASAMTVLTPYIKDAGTEALKTVGEMALGKAKDLLSWLKDRFSGDPVATKDLSRYESNPEKFESVLQSTLEEKIQGDAAFAGELQKRVNEFGSDLKVFQRIKDGKNIIGIDADSAPEKADVHQEADKVENMTGIRIKKA